MGLKGLFDTNILIDYLNRIEDAKKELKKYDIKIISIITWIEVLVGASSNSNEEKRIKNFLRKFRIVTVNQQISETVLAIRKKKKIKLPDATIWATAIVENTILVTRNIKDFPSTEPIIRVPY